MCIGLDEILRFSQSEQRITEVVLRNFGFHDPSEALRWIVNEFKERGDCITVGCGSNICGWCNSLVFWFIEEVESMSGRGKFDQIVLSEFDGMTIHQQANVAKCYERFFRCGGRSGVGRLEHLQWSLRDSRYFFEKRLSEDKQSRLYVFGSRISQCASKIRERENQIIRLQLELHELRNQIKQIERSRDREGWLVDFERLEPAVQIDKIICEHKPLAFYEGRLGNIIDWEDLCKLPKSSLNKLLQKSKGARRSRLPQVVVLRERLMMVMS